MPPAGRSRSKGGNFQKEICLKIEDPASEHLAFKQKDWMKPGHFHTKLRCSSFNRATVEMDTIGPKWDTS